MNFTALAHSIIGKNLDDCSVDEIKQLTVAYPYFAPAQFLLIEKLKSTKDPESGDATSKAALFYHNILKLDQVLNPAKFENNFSIQAPPAERNNLPDLSEQDPLTDSQTTQPVQSANLQESNEPPQSTNTTNTTNTADTINTAAPLTFEPYHMVDYFASQGIKLSREEETKDQFGKQLKSFTEWLKTMKRLPVSQMVAQLDSSSEHKVVNLAEHSVNESDIVTESMAEVWLKQGNKQKAIAIYNKLSLQNPSKKPYFADLIEKLK